MQGIPTPQTYDNNLKKQYTKQKKILTLAGKVHIRRVFMAGYGEMWEKVEGLFRLL